jgi:oligopeptide/dipeptide ABC transporter ATP-binding protein
MNAAAAPPPTDPSPLLSVAGLTTLVHTRTGAHPAVDNVSFTVARGETLGIVGESGSGKSLTALSVLRLNPTPATELRAGRVVLDGDDLTAASPRQLRRIRGAKVSIILQDPNTALNPVWTVGNQIGEALRLHRPGGARQRRADVVEALRLLRVSDPELRTRSYPHQLSGGMRQRAVGAIALACGPSLLIADEPTTALDVTIQAAFLQHLRHLQRTMNLGILFITHDFAVVAAICDRVGVMYAGELVEMGAVDDVRRRPVHPYTQALVRSVPDLHHRPDRLVAIPGKPPAVSDYPSGCRFHPRCWLYERRGRPGVCRGERPAWSGPGPGRGVACHFAAEAAEAPLPAAGASPEERT